MAPFEYDRSWQFGVAPEALWALLVRTDDFPRWWPWLQALRADGLHQGAQASFTVQPPLPYRLHVKVALQRVETARSIDAQIGGDVRGPARLELRPTPQGCEARLVWSLELRRPLLVAAERLARPAMVWGHDQVVSAGVSQFCRRALHGRG